MSGKVDNAYCLVRPPGHHAERVRCLLHPFLQYMLLIRALFSGPRARLLHLCKRVAGRDARQGQVGAEAHCDHRLGCACRVLLSLKPWLDSFRVLLIGSPRQRHAAGSAAQLNACLATSTHGQCVVIDLIEQAFWSDPSVLFVSLHQDNLYPINSGAVTDIGGGAGEGYTVNVPLPPGTGSFRPQAVVRFDLVCCLRGACCECQRMLI